MMAVAAAGWVTAAARVVRGCRGAVVGAGRRSPPPPPPVLEVFHDDSYTLPLRAGHRFPMERYVLVRDAVVRDVPGAVVCRPRRMTREEAIRGGHDAGYVDAFLGGMLPAKTYRAEIGFTEGPDPRLVERTLRLAGGTLEAASRVLARGGIAGNLGGGTHHAHADRASGFCIFNDLAIVARLALEGRLPGAAGAPAPAPVTSVLVVDLDVHQGDGTATMLEGVVGATTLSVHAEKNFPARKARSTTDVGLPDDVSCEAYLEAVEAHVARMMDTTRPGLVLYQAGVDPLAEDALGRMQLNRATLQRRNDIVFRAVEAARCPTVVTMGGGYARPIAASVQAHVDVFAAALETHRRMIAHSR